MGQKIRDRQHSLEAKLAIALVWLQEWSGNEADIHERVHKATGVQYRGASPIGGSKAQGESEPIAQAYAPPPCPNQATLIAVDGSQIYPDPHASALYYLINMGVIVVHHGQDAAPTCSLHPQIVYDETHLYNGGYLIRNAVVNARRTITERECLAEAAAAHADEARPLVAVADGPLLFWVGSESIDQDRRDGDEDILETYLDALADVRDKSRAALAGYVDRPTSTYVIRLLHLLSLEPDKVDKDALATNGEIEGLNDIMLFGRLLAPGERSALFVQRSPTNKLYALRHPELEIAFFYMNAAMPDASKPNLARVEMPMWAAKDRELVGQVQALLYNQCLLAGRYPYIITRADELAVVKGFEKKQLDNMIEVELRKHGMAPEPSSKAQGKSQARAQKGRLAI